MVRTSITDPMIISTIELDNCKVGFSLCPGKKQKKPRSGDSWDRCLNTDLELISNAGFDVVVSLIEDFEFSELDVEELSDTKTSEYGMSWIWAPIVDGYIPSPEIAYELNSIIESLVDSRSVFIHCKGGLGRAGTIASWLLTHNGYTAEDAILKARTVRKGAVENMDQVNWIKANAGRRL